jgi:hypothetical protein
MVVLAVAVAGLAGAGVAEVGLLRRVWGDICGKVSGS